MSLDGNDWGTPRPKAMEYKLTIVIRSDLAMSPGKIAAQAVHAALQAVHLRTFTSPFSVIVCKATSEQELLDLARKSTFCPIHFIQDAGRTEVSPGTYTAMAIGPATATDVDAVTGGLALL